VIDRMVRAADYSPYPSPWPAPFIWLGQERMEVLRARPVEAAPAGEPPGTVVAHHGEGALVATGHGALLLERVRTCGATQGAARVLPIGSRLHDAGVPALSTSS
jgi:methionyl-tRNA formyltransferase